LPFRVKMAAVFVKMRSRGFQKKPLIVSVSAKIIKKATERNFLKRRIRAIMRPIIKKTKTDYMIIVKKEAMDTAFSELEREITAQTNKNK